MFDAQPQTNMSGMDAVLAAWSHRFRLQWTVVGDVRLPRSGGQADAVFQPAQPELIIPAGILVLGDDVDEGQLIESVALPWFEIIKELERNPDFLHQLDWRKDWRIVEELVAGAYEREGWTNVILTRRSGDGGRDIIASKPGIGAIRIYDQVKAYKPGQRVTADEVRAVLGVLNRDQNVSKGIVTTTATFAPGISEELEAFIPYRLELKDGPVLREWLIGLRDRNAKESVVKRRQEYGLATIARAWPRPASETSYFPVFTNWIQSPWFLKVRRNVKVFQPPFLHSSAVTGIAGELGVQ
jgi:restriction system protein